MTQGGARREASAPGPGSCSGGQQPTGPPSKDQHGYMEKAPATLLALPGLCGMLQICANPPKEKELTKTGAKIFH